MESIGSFTDSTCKICLDQISSNSKKLACGHEYCHEWIKTDFEMRASSRRAILWPLCKQKPSNLEIKSIIWDEAEIKRLQLKAKQEVDQDPTLHWCPSPNCENFTRMEPRGNDAVMATWECGSTFCIVCHEEWRGSHSCQTVVRDRYRNLADNNQIWKCPNCQSVIEYIGGCPHMICSICSYNFCRVCWKEWTAYHIDNPFVSCSENTSKGCWSYYVIPLIDVIFELICLPVYLGEQFVIKITSEKWREYVEKNCILNLLANAFICFMIIPLIIIGIPLIALAPFFWCLRICQLWSEERRGLVRHYNE